MRLASIDEIRALGLVLKEAGHVVYRYGGSMAAGPPLAGDCSEWVRYALGRLAARGVGVPVPPTDMSAKGVEAWAATLPPRDPGPFFVCFNGASGAAYHVGLGIRTDLGDIVTEVSGGGRNSYPGGSDYHPEKQGLRVRLMKDHTWAPWVRPVFL